MNKLNKTNYITALPDFITMQRTSFCWFLRQGLIDELQFFTRILDFSQETEYAIYGDEYGLLKPVCTLAIARRYNGNYRAQLVIPFEVRNKKTNTIYRHTKFPIVTLPMMTTSATFLLNGCERVIVSQIIRSPGVYFEKLKNQKRQRSFKRKLSTDITKLRTFLPSGDIAISEKDLFFTDPSPKYTRNPQNIFKNNYFMLPKWKSISITAHSLNWFKKRKSENMFHLIKIFKLYRILLKNNKKIVNSSIISLFFKWLNKLTISENSQNYNNFRTKRYLITYFNLLLILLNHYKKIAKFQSTETLKTYEKTIFYSLKLALLILNKGLFWIPNSSDRHLISLQNFSFLKEPLQNDPYIFSNQNDWVIICPPIYFSQNLKNRLRIIFKRRKRKSKKEKSKKNRIKNFLYNNKKHRYTKTKTRLLVFRKEYEFKTFYNNKYDEKQLYSATIIPDYGSWIRFGFQKNLKLNRYNYPIKHSEEDVTIQLDKLNQKPIIYLLKEIGLSDLEIYQNLEHCDFFYFTKPLLVKSIKANQPLLRFHLSNNSFDKISEFSRIFNPAYYRLGKIGRLQLNKKLNIDIHDRLHTITYEDIFSVTDKLITLTISKMLPDDIDHLKNRRVRSIGELLQNLCRVGFQRLVRKLRNQMNPVGKNYILSFSVVNTTVKEFFGSSQLSQYLDQTNPLSSLTHRRRISGLGPGGFDRDRVSFSVRDIHPSHYGRICPIETPEGQNVGLIASLTTCARVNKSGFLETPFWRVIHGKVLKTGNPIYLTADVEDLYNIAPADLITNRDNYLVQNAISVRYKQDFDEVSPFKVDFIAISNVQVVSVAASLIPFFEHDDANRALMGSNMQRQSVPLFLPQKPIVGTGFENQIAIDSGMVLSAKIPGIVDAVTSSKIIIKDRFGRKTNYNLKKYLRSNQQTCINQSPIIWKGESILSGQVLTDGPAINSTELALGQNVLVSYMPWQGYNFEDAILISERLIYEDVFTSVHINRYKIEIDRSSEMVEQTTKIIPNLNSSETENLNDDGIVRVGTFVKPGHILVGKVIAKENNDQLPESKLLRAIFGAKSKGIKDNSYRMPAGNYGRIIETITFNRRTRLGYKFEKIYIFIAQLRKIQVGDKIAGRHGNKGIISRILPRQDMPFLPDGTFIDIILNPLGVPSRMNVGQLYECLLGLAGDKLNCRFKILPFDEMYGLEISRILINKKLRQASIFNDQSWLFNPYAPGKMVLIDGRTGKEFENPITVGNAYMLKLIHLVDDKMHARATGPYSLITQQPLRGKAQHGGQRFGEMEVWALEGFGAAFTLKELLTIKSDDMQGRNDTLHAIVKGKEIPKLGIPESFKVLVQELRSIGLDMSTYQLENFSFQQNFQVEVNLVEKYNSFLKSFSATSNNNDVSF